tara:strand:- start:464 stop:1813 length:1350 start_codon:yes stop_codon:yes gene_type:complete
MTSKNIFIISIALEQIIFLYFVFFSYPILGARLLQLIIIVFYLFTKPHIFKIKLDSGNQIYSYLFIFLLLGLIVSYINLFLGNYQTSFFQEVLNNSTINMSIKTAMREIAVYIYFIFIFIFLLNRIIKSADDLILFFRVYRVIFLISLYAGLVTLLIEFVNGYNYNIIPRQLNYIENGATFIGARFHGFFGEPRDAMVCLSIGLLILTLEQILLVNLKKITVFNKFFYINIILIFTSFYLTDSGSALIAIILFLIIAPIYLFQTTLRNLKYIFLIATIIFCASLFINSPRFLNYMSEIYLFELFNINYLVNSEYLKYQLNNILPIILFIENMINIDVIPSMFGNGFASTAFVSYEGYASSYEETFNYPHSQITRIIFENGIIGIVLWFLIFFSSVYSLKKLINKKYYNYICLIFLFSFCAALAHRNPQMFLILGILISFKHNISRNFIK